MTSDKKNDSLAGPVGEGADTEVRGGSSEDFESIYREALD